MSFGYFGLTFSGFVYKKMFWYYHWDLLVTQGYFNSSDVKVILDDVRKCLSNVQEEVGETIRLPKVLGRKYREFFRRSDWMIQRLRLTATTWSSATTPKLSLSEKINLLVDIIPLATMSTSHRTPRIHPMQKLEIWSIRPPWQISRPERPLSQRWVKLSLLDVSGGHSCNGGTERALTTKYRAEVMTGKWSFLRHSTLSLSTNWKCTAVAWVIWPLQQQCSCISHIQMFDVWQSFASLTAWLA